MQPKGYDTPYEDFVEGVNVVSVCKVDELIFSF